MTVSVFPLTGLYCFWLYMYLHWSYDIGIIKENCDYLTGSEYDSDENLDLAEEDDIMEIEEGDKEAAKIDQNELRDEVGRIHLYVPLAGSPVFLVFPSFPSFS